MASDNRFAVLIDADNVSVKYIKIILDEISKDGIATYKRIYGVGPTPPSSLGKACCWTTPSTPSSSTATPRGKTPPIPP